MTMNRADELSYASTPGPGSGPALVSVIIPAYNAADTIAVTLASVRAQSYRSIEIIVVDDGSTDDTLDIVRTIARDEPRLRIIAQANGGVARARNAAIAQAQGVWIAPIDADDIWHPDKLMRQMQVALSAAAPVLVYSWCRRIDAQDRVISDQGRPMHEGMRLDQLLGTNFLNNASNAMVRTDVARAVGGFEEAFQAFRAYGAEDIAFYLAVAERGPIAPAPGFLIGYRITGAGMSASARRMRMSIEMALFQLEQRRPDLSPSLLALSRTFYDLYAAGLALRSGQRRQFAGYLARAAIRRPGVTALFLCCAPFWLRTEARAMRESSLHFADLAADAPGHTPPLSALFDRFRAARIRSAAARRR